MANDFKDILLSLGDEERLVGNNRREAYRREWLFPKIFASLFDITQKAEVVESVNCLITECVLKQVNLTELIASKIHNNNFNPFIQNNLDRWYIALNYLTGRNPQINQFLESQLPASALEMAQLKTDEIIKERLRLDYAID